MSSSTHYSFGQTPALMDNWARTTAKLVRKFAKSKKSNKVVLCYTGMSGISHAVALSMALHRLRKSTLEVGMVYVRKEYEDSHGRKVEVSTDLEPYDLFIFVDDFIANGTTFDKVQTGLSTVCINAKLTAVALAKHLGYCNTTNFVEPRNLTVLMPKTKDL